MQPLFSSGGPLHESGGALRPTATLVAPRRSGGRRVARRRARARYGTSTKYPERENVATPESPIPPTGADAT
jgi:hypothetical protein